MTTLECAMESMICVFHKYAKEDGDGKMTLSKKDLKKLLENELPSFLKSQKDPHLVDTILKDLDHNKDEKLDFDEFIPLVTGLSMACEKCYCLHQKKGKK